MRVTLLRIPHRRTEILIALLVTLGLMGLLWVTREGDYGPPISIAAIEYLVPLLIGIISAGLLADDPTLELLLTAPRPTHLILAERIFIMLVLGALLCIVLQVLANTWGVFLPYYGIDQAFIWISPLVFFCGVSSAASLIRGRMLDGVIVCLIVTGMALLSNPLIVMSCQQSSLKGGCWMAIFNPLVTSILPYDPYWPINRTLWLVLGALLIGASLLLARQGERLFQTTPVE